MYSQTASNGVANQRVVFFFDIDNCLYPRSAKVHDLMVDMIESYFENNLSVSREEAVRLHTDYYQNYGLAIKGLVENHQIDPLQYNSDVDDALPLDGVIVPRPEITKLLQDIDRSKVKLWLLTNAYINHAERVIRLMGLEGVFEGLTYCDYGQMPFICKPEPEMFHKAMKEAGVDKPEHCFFVDDSYINCKKAQELGWTVAHLVEEGVKPPKMPASKYQIQHLEELRSIHPQFFKTPPN